MLAAQMVRTSARFTAVLLLLGVGALLASCVPGTYTPPTPEQRLRNDISYCRGNFSAYRSAASRSGGSYGSGGFYAAMADSMLVSQYENTCIGITLPPTYSYDQLLRLYESGVY